MKKDQYNDLEQIYLMFAEPLYFYLLKLTGSHFIAEELVQETFYRATLSLDLYEEEQIKSWLFKVARHAYLDEWRKNKRWQWVPFYNHLSNSAEMISPDGLPEKSVIHQEIKEDVIDVMSLLPENYRTIIYLREYKQFSYEDLAGTMDLSLNQVKVTLYRARERFKQLSKRLGKKFNRGDKDGME